MRNASSSTTPSIASSNSSGKRDMWTPFCDGSRSTVQSIVARISFSRAPRPMRTAFWTPVTPGARQAERHLGRRGLEVVEQLACRSAHPGTVRHGTRCENDTSFARLVSLACHDVRTPLATVHGFAKTLDADGASSSRPPTATSR